MAVIGNLIKLALEIKQTLTSETQNAHEAQKKELSNLLAKASTTAFGKYYGFDRILNEPDVEIAYRKSVPIYDYHEMHRRWWAQQQVESDITWPGKPDYFALSSGTTGKKSKRIPVTDDMIKSVRSVGLDMISQLPNYNLPAELFEKEILMLGSSADLDQNQKGFLEGEISGINTSNLPGWYETFYRPGKEIAMINDWDARVQKIAEEAPNWDIAAICGIPSWVIMMLKKVIAYHNVESIHDIWPNLKIFVSGGVAFEPYRQSFEEITSDKIIYMDTYLASEGFFAYTAGPDNMTMKLAVENGIYFEFIPFDERGFDAMGNILENPEVLSISEVENDVDYALIMSTTAGAWRYLIGDTIKFVDVSSNEIVISGRTKFFLNVVGSQLSEEKINTAIQTLAEHYEIKIDEYCVAALKDHKKDLHYHQWVLGSDLKANAKEIAQKLDEILSELNKNYRVARSKALSDIKVKVITKQEFYEALSGNKEKGGQLKTPKVMSEEKMLKFLDK